MKKIIILLIAAYIGFFAWQIYRKTEYNKYRGDQNWQYFKKIIFARDIDKSPLSLTYNLLRWASDIKIKTEGVPSTEDLKTIESSIARLNTLIAPQKIILSDSGTHAMTITFLQKSVSKIDTGESTINAFARSSIRGVIDSKNGKQLVYKALSASLVIRTDSTNQLQRNRLLVKGIVHMLIGLGENPSKKTQKEDRKVDANGNQMLAKFCYFNANGSGFKPFYADNFKTSIFNSHCSNCDELADIDRYIIKTYYSPDLDKMISLHNQAWFHRNFMTYYYTLIALCTVFILLLYFSGFLGRTVFLFIDNKLKDRWIAFNCKTISIYFIFLITWISSSLLLSYIHSSVDHKLFPLGFDTFITSMSKAIFDWLVYILVLVNIIYFIEKVWLTRPEQFAKQQLFSFIIFVLSILFTKYLLDIVFFKLYFFQAPLIVGGVLGLARFLFNYSNYQRKLAVVEKEQEIKVLRELKTRAELNALQSKINPHFLYNALNSIAGLAHENADKVEQMALALSKLFRYSINKEDTDFATVQNEAEMVTIYLEIEKIRYDDRLEYSIEIAEGAKDQKIPMFIIQPLVENAIKHGIANVTGKARLTLVIGFDKSKLLIKVGDNGPAFPEDLITGFGLHGIYEKLDILYPGNYEIKMQNGVDKNISILLNTTER